MKTLSIKQPWAELILQGRKKIEIRKWNTNFRGEFLIHSSQIPDKESMEKFGFRNLPLGFIVGKVKLINVKIYENDEEFLGDENLHLAGKGWGNKGFILKDPQRIKKIKAKGNLGFWEFGEKTTLEQQVKLASSSEEIVEIYKYIKPFNLDYPDYDEWVEKCKKELESDYKKAYYVKKGSDISGVIIFQPYKKGGDMLEIKNFRVSLADKKEGIGSLLYNSLELYAKKQNFKIIQVDTHSDGMVEFLLKKGFNIIKKETLYSPSQMETILQKNIGDKK